MTASSRRRSLRSRLSWSATAVVALWMAALAVGANVLLAGALGGQADSALRARAQAAAETVRTAPGGGLQVADTRGDSALDVGTWIFDARGGMVEAPPGSSAAADRQARDLAAGATSERSVTVGLPDRIRLLALPVRDGTTAVATVVTSTSLTPYDQLRRLAGIGTAVLVPLLLVVVHLALRANVARALRPVREMSAQADEWSAEHVDRRFGEAPRPAELAELGHRLDDVLDRLAAAVRHERQLSEELSHELRTPLARIQAEAELLRGRPRTPAERERALDVIDESTESMRTILETLMTAARTANARAPGRCSPADVLEPLVRRSAVARPDLEARTTVPRDLVAGVDPAVVERMVSPLLDNAVRYARRWVRVTATREGGSVRLLIADDGPGIPAEQAEQVFQPGWRGDADDGHDGAGLGLALVRRVATAADATVSVVPSASGACFAVDLPAA